MKKKHSVDCFLTVYVLMFCQEVVSSEPQILMTSTGEPIYQVNTEQELLASLSQVNLSAFLL